MWALSNMLTVKRFTPSRAMQAILLPGAATALIAAAFVGMGHPCIKTENSERSDITSSAAST